MSTESRVFWGYFLVKRGILDPKYANYSHPLFGFIIESLTFLKREYYNLENRSQI